MLDNYLKRTVEALERIAKATEGIEKAMYEQEEIDGVEEEDTKEDAPKVENGLIKEDFVDDLEDEEFEEKEEEDIETVDEKELKIPEAPQEPEVHDLKKYRKDMVAILLDHGIKADFKMSTQTLEKKVAALGKKEVEKTEPKKKATKTKPNRAAVKDVAPKVTKEKIEVPETSLEDVVKAAEQAIMDTDKDFITETAHEFFKQHQPEISKLKDLDAKFYNGFIEALKNAVIDYNSGNAQHDDIF